MTVLSEVYHQAKAQERFNLVMNVISLVGLVLAFGIFFYSV